MVILAGGLGTRLKPYTTVFPKPLMPVGGRPILEIVIRQLQDQHFKEIVLSVGHLAELIEAYFLRAADMGLKVRISYEREEEPLGTAGPLRRIPGLDQGTFLVLNGDLLVTGFDFRAFLESHKKSGAVLTIARFRRVVHNDFGVLEIDDAGNVTDYLEKPAQVHWVSMGIYAYQPKALEYISQGEKLDFPDLVLRLLRAGEKVHSYHDEKATWLDIGRPEDYEQAQNQAETLLESYLTNSKGGE